MELNIEIGPYKLVRRTEYSKYQLFDRFTNSNVTNIFPEIVKKIVEDYTKQKLNPEKYFEISGEKLIQLKKNEDLNYIFVPEYVKFIECYAFENSKMEYIKLPERLTFIEECAFKDCHSLKSIEIPDSVNVIEANAFNKCIDLESVKLSSSLKRIAIGTFFDCPCLDCITIPDSVTSICSYAFSNCSGLKTIELSKNIETLEDNVFYGCESLEKIDLHDVKNIGEACFIGCEALKEVKLPNTINSFSSGVFVRCKSLESIRLPSNMDNISAETFWGCCSLKDVKIPDNVSHIKARAFSGTSSIEVLNIPEKLQHIEKCIFCYCGVKALVFNHSLEKITVDKTLNIDAKGNKKLVNLGITDKSQIEKLIINNNVETITPDLFGSTGFKITSIDYLGTKEEFKRFKNNNKQLFNKCLVELKQINFIEKDMEKLNSKNDCERRLENGVFNRSI